MKQYQDISLKLCTLTVFRSILDEKPLKLLKRLFAADDSDIELVTGLYCAFVHELYKTTDSLTEWVTDYVCESENLYVNQITQGKEPGALRLKSMLRELSILGELASIKSSDVIAAYNLANGPELPQWKSEPVDLVKIYDRRLNEIPTKGYGIFAKYHMFVVDENGLVPVRRPDPQRLSSLYGYEAERKKVLLNTYALVEGRPANNVLLYGDAGTGKSSTVKAVANELKDRGVRLVEVRKNQLYLLPGIMDSLEGSPLKFIIFIDDLSFSGNDTDFAALKAILEGSVGTRGDNIVVYATSNRRHLVKESMEDREGDDIHLSDTIQELQSLSARFGLTVTFLRPEKELYCEIVSSLAREYNIDMDTRDLMIKAEAHAIRNGGRSPRVARQFIELIKAGVIM